MLYVNVNVMYACVLFLNKSAAISARDTSVNKTYSISDLASEFSITTRTIRFYEEKGYLNPKREGTRRVYSSPDRTSLRLILRGKRLGLTLDETAELIKMYGSPAGNRSQLKKFIVRIGDKRAELARKQRDLEVMMNDLQNVEDKCYVALAQYSKQA